MTVKRLVQAATLVVVAVLVGPLPVVALEPLAVYEDWGGGVIRSDRWLGGQGFGGQEVTRAITPGDTLLFRYRRQGLQASDTGSAASGPSLNTAHPTQVNEIEATFTVDSLNMTVCAANNVGAATRARPAQLVMQRFNDGTQAAPGNQTGDYQAGVQATRNGSSTDPAGILQVQGFVLRCTNASCGTTQSVSSTPLGTVSVGQTFTLGLKWDQANHQFLASRDNSGDMAMPYAASDVAPANNTFVLTIVFHTTANCTAGTVVVDSTTRVGTVRTNSSAVIP
jgi:hypothetical protein